MIRRYSLIFAGTALLIVARPASAQVVFGPVGYNSFFNFGYQRGHLCFGGGYRYAAPVYGHTYFYAPPPIVILRPPPVVFRDREPAAPENDPFPRVDDYAPARVDAAVKRGDFVVVKPGRRIVPVAAAIPLPKPPDEPKALAAFLVKQARQAFEVEQIGRAGERLRSAIALRPNEAQPHFWLAQIRIARGEYAEATTSFSAGLALEPGWPATPFNLIELYGPRAASLAADFAELRSMLISHPSDAGLQFAVGVYEWFSGNRQTALKLFEKAKPTYPVECQFFFDAAKK